jgi:hypothetical protein
MIALGLDATAWSISPAICERSPPGGLRNSTVTPIWVAANWAELRITLKNESDSGPVAHKDNAFRGLSCRAGQNQSADAERCGQQFSHHSVSSSALAGCFASKRRGA